MTSYTKADRLTIRAVKAVVVNYDGCQYAIDQGGYGSLEFSTLKVQRAAFAEVIMEMIYAVEEILDVTISRREFYVDTIANIKSAINKSGLLGDE
tara:strand:- start:11743 stop:12027 length:285 start_codon:yes stop_codon:yes gene_type:complete